MASRIEPDAKRKAAAAPQAAKPAAARPAAARPAGPPPAAAKPAKAAQRGEQEADEDGDDGEANALATGFVKNMPAWAISMLVHIVALLAMALMVTPPPEKEKVTVITSSGPEVEEEFEDISEDEPVEQTEQVETADMVAPTDVTVVEPVQVVSNADDVDAAPLTVELSAIGDSTAPATEMMSTIGVAGGKGSGLGGRANASALAAAGGGGGDTESAVDRALKWFVQHQLPDGSWSFDHASCPQCGGKCSHPGSLKDPGGATSMALLPFLGRGYTHKEGPYKKEVERGLAFLAGLAAKQEGKCYSDGRMYVQGLAGITLSEAYGMTQDNRLQGPAQMALYYIEQAQDPVGGGWRYQPKQAGDTSAVGWQIMALKSGNMAYLNVNGQTIKNAIKFLDSVEEDSGAYYGYTGPGRGPATTAVGLLCRMYLGWKKDHPALQRGVEFLAKKGPSPDLYFDYYATQIMHHMEGDVWVAWNNKMKKMLVDLQKRDGHEAGSWYDGVSSGHGAHSGGRIYCTSLATMILEVYYRHMPLYRNQGGEEGEFKE